MKKKHGNNEKKVIKRIMKMTCLLNIGILRANETDKHTQKNHSTCDGIVIVTLLLSSREKRNRFYFYDFWYGNNNDNDDDDEYERFIYDANTSAQWLAFSYQTNRHG